MPNKSQSPNSNSRKPFRDVPELPSLTGLKFILKSHSPYRRVIWLVVLLTCFCMFIYQLVVSYDNLLSYNNFITKDIIISDELTFPAITFCNINMMQRSKINGTEAQIYIDNLSTKGDKTKKKTLSSSFDIKKAVEEYGHTAEDMIRSCMWNGSSCTYLNFTTSYSYRYGLCHTFNSGQDGHQVVKSITSGKDMGLALLVDIDTEEYYGNVNAWYNGIIMAIHNQHEQPMIEDNGMEIKPGFITNIRLKRHQYRSLPSPYKADCASKTLQTTNHYSKSTCIEECRVLQTIQKCGCKLLGMPNLPGFENITICSLANMSSCDAFYNVESTYLGIRWQKRRVTCNCPTPCHQTTFTTHDYTAMPANALYQGNFKDQRSDLLLLYVYYQDLDTDVIIEVPSYNGTLFIPDVGGYLGLFMGCSVLTVCEFIDSLIIFCIRKYKARKSSHSDALQLPSDSPKTPSESLLKPPDFLENKDDDDTEAFDESKI